MVGRRALDAKIGVRIPAGQHFGKLSASPSASSVQALLINGKLVCLYASLRSENVLRGNGKQYLE